MSVFAVPFATRILDSVNLIGSARNRADNLVYLLGFVGLIALMFLGLFFWAWRTRRKNRETAARIDEIREANPFWTKRGLDLARIESLPEEEQPAAIRRTMADLQEIDALLSGWAEGPPAASIMDTSESPMAKEREAIAQLIEELETTFRDVPTDRAVAKSGRDEGKG